MEYRQLMNFLAVCEERNFTKAAKRRFITQQGLSCSIGELEKEFGTPLFDRSSRKNVLLTEYGAALERAARAYTNQHDYILETIRSMKEQSANRLSVGLNTDYFFPPNFLADFIVAHPEIDLSVKTFPPDLCQRYLREQSLQIGFSYLPVDTDIFEAVLLRKYKIRLVVGTSHPLAARRSVRMKELRSEKLIVFTTLQEPNLQLMNLCRRNGIVPDTPFTAVDQSLAAELCSTGRFVALSGEKMNNLKDLAVIDIEDEEIFVEICLLVNRRAFINQAAKTFIEYAKEKLAE
jgi:DNA-binding transcriptional LysR family regulator